MHADDLTRVTILTELQQHRDAIGRLWHARLLSDEAYETLVVELDAAIDLLMPEKVMHVHDPFCTRSPIMHAMVDLGCTIYGPRS